jgi:hypothetical protein
MLPEGSRAALGALMGVGPGPEDALTSPLGRGLGCARTQEVGRSWPYRCYRFFIQFWYPYTSSDPIVPLHAKATTSRKPGSSIAIPHSLRNRGYNFFGSVTYFRRMMSTCDGV